MKMGTNFKIGPGFLANAISKDWLLKLVSLGLAVVLWYFVGGEDRVDKNVMIPIEIINLPRDLVISNQFKKEIEVTVSGPRSLILDMSNRAITRQIDLSDATPGTMVTENDNDHIPVPRGITVQRVQPSSIILSLDKLIDKDFLVIAKTVGEVAKGYYVKKLQTDPETISITGPRTVLAQFDELYTKELNLDEVNESTQLQVPLELDSSIVDLIGETSVTVDLEIGLKTVTKTLTDIKVNAEINGEKREVSPAVVKVTANIPKLLLARDVDIRGLFNVMAVKMAGESDLLLNVVVRPEVELPIEILSVIPSSVKLTDGLFTDFIQQSGVVKAGVEPISSTEPFSPVEVPGTPSPGVKKSKTMTQVKDSNSTGSFTVLKPDKKKIKIEVEN